MSSSDRRHREPPSSQPLIPGEDRVTPWPAARNRLQAPEKYRTYWLSNVSPYGRPNDMPVLGEWFDGAFYFITGKSTRNGKNLSGNPRCVVSMSHTTVPSLDWVTDGEATKVTDDAKRRP